jgi:hypothetical protein
VPCPTAFVNVLVIGAIIASTWRRPACIVRTQPMPTQAGSVQRCSYAPPGSQAAACS